MKLDYTTAILKPLTYVLCGTQDSEDVCETRSPTHDYVIAQNSSGKYDVRYVNKNTTEADTATGFTSIDQAKQWIHTTHAEGEIKKWLSPNPIQMCANWFHTASSMPTIQNLCAQHGADMEEFAEMLECLGHTELASSVSEIATRYKTLDSGVVTKLAQTLSDESKVVELCDAHVDKIVTAIGCMEYMGVDANEMLQEVNHSNYSKFIDGKCVRERPQGKILKGPHYQKPRFKDIAKLAKVSVINSINDILGRTKY